ncbi:fungal zn2-cys6 binuclear cluster domain-containing protein [Fusarium flagelliforme]|uniref:Fungal zn2-cys6 binuclear cluster domain-containing protein n=1 Tax=Fusarium flagelliforme TaxID=2675880 RepID=A0A395N0B1_9HYPO|nr:fungal zn2-cys6 binuclear cluster domain-containing protein [Fusarium flagelliforme]
MQSTSSDTQIFRRFLFDWTTPADASEVYSLSWFAHLPNIYAKASVDSLVHRSFKALANASYGQRFNSSEALTNANKWYGKAIQMLKAQGLIMESMALEGSWVSHTSGGAALLSIRGQDKIMKSPEEFEVSAVSFQQMIYSSFLTGVAPSVSWSSVNELGLPDLPYFYEHTEHMYQAACLFAEWRTALLNNESDDDLKHLFNIANRALALDKRYEEWAHRLPPSSVYTPKSLSIESQPEWLQPLLNGPWKPLNTHTYPSLMIQVLWRFYWMVRAILNQALLFTNGIFGQRQAKANPIFPHRANIESNILSFTDLLCESCLSTLVNVTKRVPDHMGAEAVPSLWGYLILQVLPTIGLCLEQVVLPDIDLSGRREWAAKLRHFLRVNLGIAKGATAIPPSHVGKIPIQTWGLPHKLPDSAK